MGFGFFWREFGSLGFGSFLLEDFCWSWDLISDSSWDQNEFNSLELGFDSVGELRLDYKREGGQKGNLSVFVFREKVVCELFGLRV